MSQQRIILITGSNKGIGLEMVRELAITNKNSTIVGTARQQADAEKTISNLKQENGITNVKFELLDVKNSKSIEILAKSITEKYGRLDVLVHNAAAIHTNLDITPESTDLQLQTNVYGVIELTEKLLPLLKKSNDARIVIVGSRGGNLNTFSQSLQIQYLNARTTRDIFELAYSFEAASKHNDVERIGYPKPQFANTGYKVSKALVHAYIAVLAIEHPEITSTCFCPGPVDTEMARSVDTFKFVPNPATPKQGADTGVFLVNSEKKTLENGGFYSNRKSQSRVNAAF